METASCPFCTKPVTLTAGTPNRAHCHHCGAAGSFVNSGKTLMLIMKPGELPPRPVTMHGRTLPQ